MLDLVTAKGQIAVATANNNIGVLDPPTGTGNRSPAVNANTKEWSYPANLNSQISEVTAGKVRGELDISNIPDIPIATETTGDLPGSRISGDVASAVNATNAGNADTVDRQHFLVLTQAEYNAIQTPDPNTWYATIG